MSGLQVSPVMKRWSERVERDKGCDVVGIPQVGSLEWANFQCKHYDHPLMPSEVWVELGKVCFYTYIGDYSVLERVLDPVQQTALVLLDCEDLVGILRDDLLGDAALIPHRINGY
jgi:hypothetical protein